MTKSGELRRAGVNTPTYRADSWKVDWSRRNGKLVWARNPLSKMPSARDWHWVDFHTLTNHGVKWQPKREKTGRYLTTQGYINLTRRGMSTDEIEIAERFSLFRGARRAFVREHQLAAVKKYGYLPEVVRHLNGVKSDNQPENIVGGTTQENTMDHVEARLMAMYWREKYEDAQREIERLRRETQS